MPLACGPAIGLRYIVKAVRTGSKTPRLPFYCFFQIFANCCYTQSVLGTGKIACW